MCECRMQTWNNMLLCCAVCMIQICVSYTVCEAKHRTEEYSSMCVIFRMPHRGQEALAKSYKQSLFRYHLLRVKRLCAVNLVSCVLFCSCIFFRIFRVRVRYQFRFVVSFLFFHPFRFIFRLSFCDFYFGFWPANTICVPINNTIITIQHLFCCDFLFGNSIVRWILCIFSVESWTLLFHRSVYGPCVRSIRFES